MNIPQLLAVATLTLFTSFSFAEQAPDSVKKLVPDLKSWGENQLIVSAVKEQNSKGMTLDQIKARDAEWQKTTGLDDKMKAMIESAAGKELTSMESSKPYFFEVFLMDNLGANVAMTNKTSDYWQGDEAKFTESYKGGAGAVHISDIEFDESAQAYLVQISVPVMDGSSAIGAMTIGINIDELENK
jgi:hypothetical protein